MRSLLIACITVSIITFSCESTSPEIGSDFFNDGALDFSYIDTATIKLSTIQFEKLETGNGGRLMVGSYRDEKLGKIGAMPYFQVTSTSTIDFQDENVVYDYIALVLPFDTYAYYDTTAIMALQVFKVTETIQYDEGHLYNTTKFAIGSEPLGSLEFKPRPHHDSVEIRLSDVLGQEIFQKAKSGGSDLDASNFRKYLPGLAVIPDTSRSSCLLGLSTNPKLKLYYRDKSVTPVQQRSVVFDVKNASNIFHTHISYDRKSTMIDVTLDPEDRLNSQYTEDRAYIQAGTGLALRIDMPYLRDLKQLSNFYVTQAILEIYPVRKSSRNGAPLPKQLNVFKADKRNAIYTDIETPVTLFEDQDLDRDTRYAFDVTEFVKEQMELQVFNENALLFTTPSETYPVSADRLYIAAPSYQYKTNLRIYFATVTN